MKRILFLVSFCLAVTSVNAQEWGWWNELHGWEPGMPGWRSYITISPGYLGPNALPVPDMNNGVLEQSKSLKVSTDFHFRTGDQTQNIAGQFYYPFSDRIAVSVYGVMLEHYSMSDQIRDERAARDRDGEGLAIGDLYFATWIQLVKGRKFPNTLLRMVGKTASGGRLDAARYADSPGYFFDITFSKELKSVAGNWLLRPFVASGFYSWQTNDMENLQNDAFMYGAGIELDQSDWNITNSVSGYSGYKDERDCPMVYTLSLERSLKKDAIQLQYIVGLRDWEYQSLKLAYIWQWK